VESIKAIILGLVFGLIAKDFIAVRIGRWRFVSERNVVYR